MIDVAIVGGGLAGSSAAIALARRGYRVVVWEQHRYPRHKMCGEFLSPETVAMFQQLGVWERIQRQQPAEINATRITVPGPQACGLDIPLPFPAYGLSRYFLDHTMLRHAEETGATVHESCAVSEVHGSLEQGFEVVAHNGTFAARAVLGAWGKRSRLDRVLERPFFTKHAPFLALKAHYRGPEPEDRTELHTFRGGYCGINRVEGDAVNVCLLATEAAWERSGKKIDAFWEMIGEQNYALGAQLAGAEKISEDIVISNVSFARKSPVAHDILMLGDSAELISPLAGNGQAMALRGALLATPLVDKFLRGEQSADTLKRSYVISWHQHFRTRLFLGRLLQPAFLNPALLSWFLRVGDSFPFLARWLVYNTRELPARG